MATTLELLEKCFRLVEHPFNPQTDPRAKPPFSFKGRSLQKPLKIYEHADLRRYFVRVGPFASAAEASEKFMENWSAAQGPPAVIAYGPKHGGLESLAFYVAALIKNAAPSADTRFDELSPTGDSSASFLEQLVIVMRAHVNDIKLEGTKWMFDAVDKEAVSEGVLKQTLTTLKKYLPDDPWLVLFIRPITWKNRQLVAKHLELLTDLRIAPIFMTSDPDVDKHFDGSDIAALTLRVDKLTVQEGLELLQARLDAFRADPPPHVEPSHPYVPEEVEKLFQEGNQTIGFLIDRYYGALEDKLKHQTLDAESKIGWTSIAGDYKTELRKEATRGV